MRLSVAFFTSLVFWESTQVVSAFEFASPRRLHHSPASSSINAANRLSFLSYRNFNQQLRLSDTTEAPPADPGSEVSEEDWTMISGLYNKAANDDNLSLDQIVLEALPTLNPSLIMKLRGAANDSRKEFQAVAEALNSILDSKLTAARDLLTELLNAGEIRRLDAMIGKAAREGKLDVAFFQVLNMNLQDAASKVPEGSDGIENETANRFQIMQHVYTRCQEEVEKNIPPGVALLNKLLRTEVNSIRANQLNHYLCPQPNIIKSPDGKEIELAGGGKILVPHEDFIKAIADAVKQIRTVEKAGGANREMAANMVEACRTVAREARIVIGEHFGRDSEELIKYEEGLQPVFRPESPESPYMKGEA